jgi:hypothetical protein
MLSRLLRRVYAPMRVGARRRTIPCRVPDQIRAIVKNARSFATSNNRHISSPTKIDGAEPIRHAPVAGKWHAIDGSLCGFSMEPTDYIQPARFQNPGFKIVVVLLQAG